MKTGGSEARGAWELTLAGAAANLRSVPNIRRSVRAVACAVAICLALLALACGGGSGGSSGGPTFKFIGFSDHAGKDNFPPPDVVKPGGTLKLGACNPQRIYAFVSFNGLQPPKQLFGSWTLDGAFLSKQTVKEDVSSATTFWGVEDKPKPLPPGDYRLQISLGDKMVADGSVKVVC